MNFIGDYFAIGLVCVLAIFFFDSKVSIRYMSTSSVLFVFCLLTTALTAATDLATGKLLEMTNVPLWLNMFVNSLYFVVNIITTSCIALYLFVKILEHTHERHCMHNACIGLTVLFVIYMGFVLTNPWNHLLFYFDEQGRYYRGTLNALGYLITIAQLILVGICYFRNKQHASGSMRRVLMQLFPVIPMTILLQRAYPEIMLNGFLMAMVETVVFLTFQGQRQGVHSLTKLNDRRRFFAEVDHRISAREPFRIFFINLKNFGAINQKYGHIFGDEFLYQFAFALEQQLKGSLSFHMNGTVFAIVSHYTNLAAADQQSDTLLRFLEGGILCQHELVATEYILAHYISDGKETSAAELYESIEYVCAQGHELKQRYVRCPNEIRDEMVRLRYLRERIQIIDRDHGFEVWFQPVRCLASGNFCSMEALIRLREPDGSLISPAEFIPMAEQTGHIIPITWFVLEEVCKLLKNEPALAPVSVSINLPMTQLLDKDFVPQFVGLVNQYGVNHSQICIEFTERAILENFQQTLGVMEQLSEEGFRFYLDDFGSGYSNFNCLLQLPFQIIKLDASLVHITDHGTADYTMVQTLSKLFHDMNLIVIAEGAETPEEVQALAENGVDHVQGYALARPMPIDSLLKFYQENPIK